MPLEVAELHVDREGALGVDGFVEPPESRVGPVEDVERLRERLLRGGPLGDLDRPLAPLDRFKRLPLLLPDHGLPGKEVRALPDRCRVV